MTDGTKIHKQVADFVTKQGRLPDFLPNIPLHTPRPEFEQTVSFSDRFDLKGVYDVLCENFFIEVKTGTQDSSEWARSKQISLYFLIAQIAKIPVEYCVVTRFNQYESLHDFTIVHNNFEKVKEAINLVESIGPDIQTFFHAQGLI